MIERVGTVARRAGGAARDAGYALVTVAETQLRWLLLRSARGAGRVNRWTARGWFPTLRLLAGVTLLLLLGPVVVDRLSAWVDALGVWSFLDISPAPATHHWLSLLNLVIAFALLMAIRVFTQARRRVVVENFVDYTKDAEKAVSGLATLLVAELGRLRGLYDHVNQQLSVSRSVGVQARGSAAREPGAFLTVRADDLSDVFASAVASEGSFEFGGMKIPIGTLLAVIGRVFKGPRLIGSVHLTEAGGGPMLTAQIVGGGIDRSWRVDLTDSPETLTDRAFLQPMVSELACRMFTDLTLRGAVRWRAIEHFIHYLHLYTASRRTPRDRARRLREAEVTLLAALAQDDSFHLGYYNLGVVYGELAAIDQPASEPDVSVLGSQSAVKLTRDHAALHAERIDASVSAFKRA
ncbi:MAG: hypothetical protein QOG59_759, partial [Solirubrobacteraceae bacterium]|nr:hypothetical protein [Solirubrobacteraceae bacterium]